MENIITQRVAVKALVIDAQNRVLILRKSNDDERHAGKSGRFNLPGGKINIGEPLMDALSREVHEECGITLGAIGPLVFAGEWHPIVHGVQHHIVGVFYVCKDWLGSISLDGESDKYQWIGVQDIDSLNILPPEDEALRAYYAQRS